MKYYRNVLILLMLIGVTFIKSWSQQPTTYTVYNRTLEQITENEKQIVRFSEGAGAGGAWVEGQEFSEGEIEFEAKGRDVLQKSFIGIAFHGVDNETYETVYFRPFNFQSTDSLRKIHAVQYAFEPKYGFQQLRNTRKDEFESAIKPSSIQATDWLRVKVVVRANKITVFVNNFNEPCLEVRSLNLSPNGKKIGFWVGNSSNGDFANLKIKRD